MLYIIHLTYELHFDRLILMVSMHTWLKAHCHIIELSHEVLVMISGEFPS